MYFEKLCNTLQQLRGENGCAWDKAQTAVSLQPNLIEESYELIDAINNNDTANIKEELGDLYLVVTMLATIFEEQKLFTLDEALEGVTAKLIRRHPHVFGNVTAVSPEESLAIWQSQKQKEQGRTDDGYLSRVGRGLPPLERALAIDKKLTKAGYHFGSPLEAIAKVEEELAELKAEIAAGNAQNINHELGDLLLITVCLANHLQVNPSEALNYANNKAVSRFNFVVKKLTEQGLALERANLDKMEEAWQEAKSRE
ncbi:MAG: nucleoside triphosphate pyrophosphohydrolase [Spirochaetaceae bacterium]|nr:nucleoside triphosphate pyrophosphohydrolase [Spirochaetaceae bacterium]